jgi:hypothetical protein
VSDDAELTELHWHELMDRVHVLTMTFEDAISDHPVAGEVGAEVHQVRSALTDLYSAVSMKRLNFGG